MRSETATTWKRIVWAGALLTLAGTSVFASTGGPPEITSLSDSALQRSGRLLIFGSGFGADAGSGQVLIDGMSAIATTWTPSEIHAYVPEGAALGLVPVQVIAPSGSSNVVTLEVTPRQPDGRVLWRFQTDHFFTGRFVATDPDGTVYLTDSLRLYALTPGGGLKWVYANAPDGGRPITVAADGTIFTGFAGVQAIHPDGSLSWEFQPPGVSILAGPNIGPDGNIYVFSEALGGGPGVFSLDPSGNLLWSEPGDPPLWSNQINNSALAFLPNGFAAGYNPTGGLPALRAFDSSGDQLWTHSDIGETVGTLPRVDPSGRVIVGWGQVGMMAVTADAQVDWIALHPGSPNVMTLPAIGSDGVIYTGDWLGVELWAINPDGSTRWFQPGGPDLLDNIGITPDESMLLTGENGGFGFSVPAWVRAYDTADGSFLWQVEILPEENLNQHVITREPGFSPDGRTAYVMTRFAGSGVPGYLYAIDTSDATGTPYCYGDVCPCGNIDPSAGCANSTGAGALLSASGTASVAADDLLLQTTNGPAGQFAVYFMGDAQTDIPFGDGQLCVAGVLQRFNPPIPGGAAGTWTLGSIVGLTQAFPPGFQIAAGSTWNFQLWYRDPTGPCGSGFSVSNGLHVTFGP